MVHVSYFTNTYSFFLSSALDHIVVDFIFFNSSSSVKTCLNHSYLPPDPEFLMSYYDFPETFLCLFQDCSLSNPQVPTSVPFVTFFSGHIATIVISQSSIHEKTHFLIGLSSLLQLASNNQAISYPWALFY